MDKYIGFKKKYVGKPNYLDWFDKNQYVSKKNTNKSSEVFG